MSGFARFAAVLVSLLLPAGLVSAQECGVLPPWTAPAGAPQFSPQQTQWLYQFQMDQFMGGLATVDDATLTAELQHVLARLLQHVPVLSPAPQVHLLQEDFTDAETYASGQIFISRALIRSLHSEGELAAILAHELGHYYAGQPAIQFAADFDKVLNHQPPAAGQAEFDTQLNRWETWREAHLRDGGSKGEDSLQQQADEAGMEILRRSGYDSHAMANAFDRIAGTQGNTGNWFSSWLGLNAPDVARLRHIEQAESTLPACPRQPPLLAPAAFTRWQASLDAYTAPPHVARLPGLITQTSLDPLRSHFNQLRFSRDGRYLLAVGADDAWVLTVEPMALLGHIEATGILSAHFNPENTAVVLATGDGRLERWNIASRALDFVRQVTAPVPGCRGAMSDTEGEQMVCVRPDFAIQVLDASTGAVRFQHKAPDAAEFGWVSQSFQIATAPDGRLFVFRGGDQLLALDLSSDAAIHLSGDTRDLLGNKFVLGYDGEAMAMGDDKSYDWKRLNLFSGKVEGSWKLSGSSYSLPASGSLLIARPYFHNAAAVIDPAIGKVLAVTATEDLDAYGNLIAGESARGMLVLVRVDPLRPGQETPVAHLELPRPQLQSVIAAEASSDLRYLAVSQAHRGALWDLSRPQLPPLMLEGFDQAWFTPGHLWLHDVRAPNVSASIPKLGYYAIQNEVDFDLATGKRTSRKLGVGRMERPERSQIVSVSLKDDTIQVEDLATGKPLWNRKLRWDTSGAFMVQPGINEQSSLLAFWLGDNSWTSEPMDKAARQAIDDAPDHRGAFWYEIVNAQTGAYERSMVLSPSPIPNPTRAYLLDGDLYLPSVDDDRVIGYKVSTGKPVGIWDGEPMDYSAAAHGFALLRTHFTLGFYPAEAAQPRIEWQFPERVTFAQFSADGQRLLVVTRDQTAYVLAVPAPPGTPAPSGRNPL